LIGIPIGQHGGEGWTYISIEVQVGFPHMDIKRYWPFRANAKKNKLQEVVMGIGTHMPLVKGFRSGSGRAGLIPSDIL
jgi:hypothetical protein